MQTEGCSFMLSFFSIRVMLPLAALPLALLLASCSVRSGADDELLVFAATSLTNAMSDAAAEFEASAGAKVEISYGPSRALAQQIARGAAPDLYIAAGQPPMDLLKDEGIVSADGVVRLLSNKIVFIAGRDAPNIGSIEELPDAEIGRIVMPDPEIAPAGNYTKTALQNLGLWDRLLPRIVFANDVRATLSYVQTGNAAGGFLYQTDAATADDITVLDIVPVGSYPDVVYPAAVMRNAENRNAAESMLEFLKTRTAKEIFRKQGFTPLE